ncbi:DUF4878 domain-containing protein [Neolewinella lacunae]|uniref:DUF4878 domain-containing protein n=1 Tax=Neolewinella lacunae TaxID=1517758 RepID=A0A923PLP4_9BACT|nr:DUF4878 domain-containing protein [Neolewinella lacunae]MBC6994730.1 DUF4878 domain-containing protein [Neolewinella lacunae]MDN3634602.1 DUF4878 domain-containing protein [Neolewinella lacunae]
MTPKVLVFYLSVAFLGALVSGCGSSGKGTPSEVVSLFLDELYDKDFNGAKKYGTERTAGMLDMAQAMLIAMGKIDEPTPEKREDITIASETIEGETAVVVTHNAVNGKDTTYELVKVDGKWKIDQESIK